MWSQNNTDFSISDNAKHIGSETELTILHEFNWNNGNRLFNHQNIYIIIEYSYYE